MSDEGFLSRWSRRKHQADRAKRQTAVAKEASATAPIEDGEAVPPLSAEEIAHLPRVEDLTVASDLTQFLRAGVPISLRRAAPDVGARPGDPRLCRRGAGLRL
jgi:hypothetical protein